MTCPHDATFLDSPTPEERTRFGRAIVLVDRCAACSAVRDSWIILHAHEVDAICAGVDGAQARGAIAEQPSFCGFRKRKPESFSADTECEGRELNPSVRLRKD